MKRTGCARLRRCLCVASACACRDMEFHRHVTALAGPSAKNHWSRNEKSPVRKAEIHWQISLPHRFGGGRPGAPEGIAVIPRHSYNSHKPDLFKKGSIDPYESIPFPRSGPLARYSPQRSTIPVFVLSPACWFETTRTEDNILIAKSAPTGQVSSPNNLQVKAQEVRIISA